MVVWIMNMMMQSMENKKNKEMFIIKEFERLRVATKPPINDDQNLIFIGLCIMEMMIQSME